MCIRDRLVSGGMAFRYRRGSKGGEARLHNTWSVGLGGHINPEDKTYDLAVRREIREEVGVGIEVPKPVAVINYDGTDVGKVHFGILHVVSALSIGKTEKGVIEKGQLVTVEELRSPRLPIEYELSLIHI